MSYVFVLCILKSYDELKRKANVKKSLNIVYEKQNCF